MRILLTGASGFLGNNLLRLLVEDGHDVRVTVRANTNRRAFDGLDVEKIECDLLDATSIGTAVAAVELVIHSAAMIQIGWSKLDQSRKVNVNATSTIAQSARLHGARMIHVSTVDTLAAGSKDKTISENERDPAKSRCTYVTSKREAEVAFAEQVEAGLDGVIVNPGFMIGPWDWKPSSGQMLLAARSFLTPLAPSGGCSVVDVRDVACGIISAIEHGRRGENYILAGENLTYFDLWSRMAKLTGGRPPIGKLPSWVDWLAGCAGDVQSKLTGVEPQVNSAATEMGALYHWYSSHKAIQSLGYKIGSVDDAIADAWDWFQEFGYA